MRVFRSMFISRFCYSKGHVYIFVVRMRFRKKNERKHGFILCFVQLKWEEVQKEAKLVLLGANDEVAR